jgi:hypothetical protein
MRRSENASFIAVMLEQRIAAGLGEEYPRPEALRSRTSFGVELDIGGFDALGAKPELQGRPEGGVGGGHREDSTLAGWPSAAMDALHHVACVRNVMRGCVAGPGSSTAASDTEFSPARPGGWIGMKFGVVSHRRAISP